MTIDHMIPSVEDAQRRFANRLAVQGTAWHDVPCRLCRVIYQDAENAALALDLARSVGRRFDRQRQQAVWQAREDAALVRSVAW